jgi:hypothetical protein
MQKLLNNKKLFLLTIILVAAALRFNQLGQIPVSLYWDEVAMLVDAKSVTETGRDMHGNGWLQVLFPSYGDYKLPVYIWLASISVKFFGVSEWALRLPSFLAGVGTVITAGAIASELAGDQKLKTDQSKQEKDAQRNWSWWVKISTMIVVAVSPWSIMFSRTGFEGHFGQFLLSVSILLVIKSKSKPILAILGALLGGIATYTYFSVRFVWPVVLLLVMVLLNSPFAKKTFSFSKKNNRQLFNWTGLTLGSLFFFGLLLLPMMNSPLYEVSNQFRLSTTSVLNSIDYPIVSNQLRLQSGNTFLDRVVFHRHFLLTKELAKNLSSNLSFDFLFISGDPNLRHGTAEHGLFLLPFLPLLLIGAWVLWQKSPQQLLVLVGWWMIAILPASVPMDTPHALRSLNALVPISIIIGFGFAWVMAADGLSAQFSKSKNVKLATQLIRGVLISSILLAATSFSYHYFNIYPSDSAFDWQDGYFQLSQIISDQQSSVRTVWVTPFEDRFYLWLLAYGDYSGQQIQDLPKQNYKPQEIDNVVFQNFDWKKLESLDHRVMIVDKPENLAHKIEANSIKPLETFEVLGYDGSVRFLVALYDPSK